MQQAFIFTFGSLAASTPYLAATLTLVILLWFKAAQSLNVQFTQAMAAEEQA